MSETLRFVGVALAAMVAFRFANELGILGIDAEVSGNATQIAATDHATNSAKATLKQDALPKLGKAQVLIQYCTS
ncbi:hypothetical protein AK812_SmicGene30465 [Symbiodinium microadriaticum]|uniref:Uncharacterized protein n=1 Tax=Symbiodinium microadriaticum TaxID=2951 RepID=A0A1Q9CZ87_SYMMI|nr:hypothetical protein AK812_SmicGene30465 [Symbiodinium microadriaticum]